MSVETFIGILVISATATSFGIELIKSFFDKVCISYKPMVVAVISAFIVGFAEVVIYAVNGNIPFDIKMVTYALCMGIVNVVGSTTGYDTVKDFIYALFGKGKIE